MESKSKRRRRAGESSWLVGGHSREPWMLSQQSTLDLLVLGYVRCFNSMFNQFSSLKGAKACNAQLPGKGICDINAKNGSVIQ